MSVEFSDGPRQTEELGAELAAALRPGDVVLVRGELGSGKTTLVRGACRALGITRPVVSPTFTIGRRYAGPVPVSHLDLYRLPDLGGEDPALLDDYLTADAIAFVEWPEVAGDVPLEEGVTVALEVELRHAGGDRREIEISGLGAVADDEPRTRSAGL
jgi:tRNA threonylcarbamoyladenosine biosynthesis protein TsaE